MAEKKRHGAPELPFPWRKAYPIAGSAADDLENAFEDVVIDESDMDMLFNEDSVQMSLEDLGLQM